MDTVTINPDIFREFSIRGIADRDLADEVVIRIGQAIGAFFGERDGETLVVGRDVRRSSDRISERLIRGLLQSGLNVIDVGPVPTPVHNFATDFFKASGGVMVTASHNPPEYNGFKIRAGETLTGQTLQDLYHMAIAGTVAQKHGKLQKNDAIAPYLSALRQRVTPGRPLKLVVDGGNGANGPLVTTFLREQGHQVIELYTEPDGAFPNRNPDPTAEHALSAAAQLVVDEQADGGLAYDGDGDRVVLIDDQGAVHFGDIILMLLARQLAQIGPFKVVHDVSCTRALADDVSAHGGESYAAPVGYAFVHHKMLDVGATLGGETAGHIFCLDEAFRFDDAILASVKLLNYITGQDRPVSELIADLPRYHTSPNYRLACPDEFKAEVIQRITRRYQTTHPVDTIDGVKITFEDGWALIRPSNTQPALTFRVEGQTAAAMERLRAELEPVIGSELAGLGISE